MATVSVGIGIASRSHCSPALSPSAISTTPLTLGAPSYGDDASVSAAASSSSCCCCCCCWVASSFCATATAFRLAEFPHIAEPPPHFYAQKRPHALQDTARKEGETAAASRAHTTARQDDAGAEHRGEENVVLCDNALRPLEEQWATVLSIVVMWLSIRKIDRND